VLVACALNAALRDFNHQVSARQGFISFSPYPQHFREENRKDPIPREVMVLTIDHNLPVKVNDQILYDTLLLQGTRLRSVPSICFGYRCCD